MPFRSEAEQIREQLRRAEEQQQVLIDERDSLRHQLVQLGGGGISPRLLLIGVIVATITAVIGGYTFGSITASKEVARSRDEENRYYGGILDQTRSASEECTKAQMPLLEKRATCLRGVEAALTQKHGAHVSPPQ